MRCPTCLLENPEGMRHCGGCGSPLPMQCPRCGGLVPPKFRFCGHCGSELGSVAEASGTIAVTDSGEDRRLLTVLFCDLVGSTALSERLDPEDLREVVRAYQRTASEVVERFSGHVAQFLGDGLLIYFGYPQAHEDDARRAVLAGLGILQAIEGLDARMALRGIRLAVRLGIHTGPVVIGRVGTDSSSERLALGSTLNIAARLQGLAEPGTLVLSHSTYKLVEPFFFCLPLGAQALKGVSRPVEVYRVVAEKGAGDPQDTTASGGSAPMVGRENARSRLTEWLACSRHGAGQAVLVVAEPGVGKSRLVRALREQPETRQHTWLPGYCSPYEETSALGPFLHIFRRLFRLRREDGNEEKLRKLEEALAGRSASGEALPLLAALLSLPPRESWAPLEMSAQKQKQRTLECIVELLTGMARERPLVFCLEDLHWADPSSLELVGMLVRAAETAPLLVLLTTRPSFNPSAEIQRAATLTLDRLNREQSEVIIAGLTRGKALPGLVLEQLLAKADGIPLFLEELTRTVLESGELREDKDRFELGSGTVSVTIPDSLRGSLTARLDRLGTVREVAKLGAVLGREFSYVLIAAISSQDPASLQRGLEQLVRAELLFQRGRLPDATFIFKHALLQEAAYELLLRTTRQQYHLRIAEVLIERFAERAAAQPELVAQHFTAAGHLAPAIAYWLKAGTQAQQRSANLEAIQHLERGVELLAALPASPERDAQELQLQLSLGMALASVDGFVAPKVERALRQAKDLCDRMDDAPELFWVLLGLRNFRQVRGELLEAERLTLRMLELAEARQEPLLLATALSASCMINFYLGDFAKAREHAERSLALGDSYDAMSLTRAGIETPVGSHAYLSLVLWHLGYPGARNPARRHGSRRGPTRRARVLPRVGAGVRRRGAMAIPPRRGEGHRPRGGAFRRLPERRLRALGDPGIPVRRMGRGPCRRQLGRGDMVAEHRARACHPRRDRRAPRHALLPEPEDRSLPASPPAAGSPRDVGESFRHCGADARVLLECGAPPPPRRADPGGDRRGWRRAGRRSLPEGLGDSPEPGLARSGAACRGQPGTAVEGAPEACRRLRAPGTTLRLVPGGLRDARAARGAGVARRLPRGRARVYHLNETWARARRRSRSPPKAS